MATPAGPTVAPALDEPAAASASGEGPLLLLFVVLTLAASAYVLVRSEHDAVHDPKEKAARGEIQGLGSLSLLRAENFRRALAKVDTGKQRLFINVRVAADRVNAETRDGFGNRRILTIDPGFGVNSSDFGVGDDFAVGSERIDPAAPERMVHAVVEKTGLPAAAVDYVTTSFSKDVTPTWYVALKQGPARNRQWIAEADGSDVRRPGEPSLAQKRAIAKERRDARARQRAFARQRRHLEHAIERRNACIAKAHDAEAAARCLERFPL